MSEFEKLPRSLYLFPYILGVILFSYALHLHNMYMLIGAIFFMFVAFMKPIYDWAKTLKDEDFDDED